jgi:hypothetical protein
MSPKEIMLHLQIDRGPVIIYLQEGGRGKIKILNEQT